MPAVIWSTKAERALLGLPPSDAEELHDAVERLATTNVGFVRDMLDGEGTRALYVGRYIVLFTIDENEAINIDKIRTR